ncbi:MAG: flagellar biosynthesis repressor FlbT [Litoreibacter sp.]|uniref:flagellar biosynthesis repressor FlbT n=1 Tax=Litoreibacter sp. TaxID=1969459 RepID=UPI003297225D
MTGLVIKLGPKERILINGAVVENGDKRSKLQIVTPDAHILRLKDALHPLEVNTPVRRVCYIMQLVLSGDAPQDTGKRQALKGIEQLNQAFSDTESRKILSVSTEQVNGGQYYQAMKSLRSLLSRESKIMGVSVK